MSKEQVMTAGAVLVGGAVALSKVSSHLKGKAARNMEVDAELDLSGDAVEVYIWVPKNDKGEFCSSFTGIVSHTSGRLKQRSSGVARVGHASLSIGKSDAKGRWTSTHHCSLFPADEEDTGLVDSLEMDMLLEGHGPPDHRIPSRPTAIIRIYGIDTTKVTKAWQYMRNKNKDRELLWNLTESLSSAEDYTQVTRASCASFVAALLIAGGLSKKAKTPWNPFYTQSRCNIGAVAGSWFNWLPGTKSNYTPKQAHLFAAGHCSDDTDPRSVNATILRNSSGDVDDISP